ncbi:MAG: ATP-binding cassette domain-containing protein [Dactylosporangium sp.]|nr:ATP-binding cassette domain-containing protein [Dactylosporangium sp.]
MSGLRLSVRDLTVAFGGVVAVDRLNLDIVAGDVLGLIGPNGAGKSTVINAITGFVPATYTEMALHDGDQVIALASSSPRQRSRLGIIRTFQTPRLIPELTVWQNVAMGTVAGDVRRRWFEAFGGPGLARGARRRHDRAVAALASLGLEALAHSETSELSLGEQRLVEIARAMVSGARVLLLDEPFAGLSSVEQKRLAVEIGKLKGAAIATLLVEHNLELVRALADTVVAMDQGAELVRGDAASVLDSREVRATYLGEVAA